MGRPERPIDPGDGPVAKFASELRKLRDEAGRPSYRELAGRVSFSVTVLSEAAGGRSFPTLAVVRGYVRACGGDVTEWEQRWLRAADETHQTPNGAARAAPYLGLASYGEEHAGLFFGREALTGDLLRRLAAGRFLAVFGASGSGKSSLLRAGLLAAVHRGEPESAADLTTLLLTPGEQPVAALAGQVAALAGGPAGPAGGVLLAEPEALHRAVVLALAGKPAGAELLLVVDQFEELFTVCTDRVQRDCFVRALLAAVTADGACTRVVLGVRADFYAQCARWPELVTALRDSQLLVGPMSQDELREVIVKPAEHAGMAVEGALVATALAEVGTEPGALALVSHALLETWRHSPPGRMTLAAYTDAGGVPNAIASTAERVYAECDDGQRALLRGLVLRLVAIGDGAPDTRRRVPPDELYAAGTGADALVEKLARARLVTVDDDSVQLAHEALIRQWPRLSEWLADSRDGLRVQRRLADAAREWARLGRDPAALYRGTPLAVARAWDARDGGPGGLTAVEREFLDASSAAQAAAQAAAVRAARRLRRLVGALAVLLAAALTAAGIAGWQRADELSAEQAAVSGRLAAQSANFANVVNSSAAILAALAAWHTEPNIQARSALLSTAGCCTATQASLSGDSGDVYAVALSPGGKLLAAGGADNYVRLWDTSAEGKQAVLRGPGEPVYALAFSPNGGVLAVGMANGTIWLWNPRLHSVLRVLTGDTGIITDLAFSPDGTLLASAATDGQVRLWNPATGSSEKLATQGKAMRAVAFSPHGGTLAAAGDDDTVTLWNVADPAHPLGAGKLTGAKTHIENLAYSPDGTMIAAEESNSDVMVWNPGRGTRTRIKDASHGAHGLAFSHDGTFLLVAGSSTELHMYDPASGVQVAYDSYRIQGTVSTLAYDPVSGSLALGGPAGSVQFWQQTVVPYTGSAGPVAGLALVPRGAAIASVSSSNSTLRVWGKDGSLADTKSLAAQPGALAVSPNGRRVATAENGGAVSVFDLPDLTPAWQFDVSTPASDVAFSPDGRLLAASGGTSVTLRDAGSGNLRQTLYSDSGDIDTIAFGPGSGMITAGTGSGTVITWSTRTGSVVADARGTPGPVDAIAFGPGGRLLATAGDEGIITLRDPATLRSLGTLSNVAASIKSLAFSPDGRVLVAGAANGTITLWDVASRTLTATLTASQDTVFGLGFAPDGKTLYSSGNGRIIAWNLDLDDVISKDCQILSGDPGLDQAETFVPGFSYAQLCPSG